MGVTVNFELDCSHETLHCEIMITSISPPYEKKNLLLQDKEEELETANRKRNCDLEFLCISPCVYIILFDHIKKNKNFSYI